MGDFNIDFWRRFDVSYQNIDLFNDLDDSLSDLNFTQLVNETTWSRTIRNVCKESILDHIYISDDSKVRDLAYQTPMFGDHKLIIMGLYYTKPKITPVMRRDWRF